MKKFVLILFSLFYLAVCFAQTTRYDSLWNDPAIEQRIRTGIEKNRMGDFTLQLPSLKGKAEIEIQQLTHDFCLVATSLC